MNIRNRFSASGIMLVALLAAMCFGLTACEEKAPERAGANVPQVRYATVKGEKLTLTRELPGRVSAFMVSEVRPQVSGIVLERLFEEGADVEKGQVLYQIDPSVFQATYNNAKANLSRAEANLVSTRLLAQRYAAIVKESAVSKQEYDDAVAAHNQAKAEVDAARAALDSAAINLGYTKVTAPVSGRIGRSFVTPGALVTQNQSQPLATVQQMDNVYVDVTQSNSELLKLRRAFDAGHLSTGGPESFKVKLKLEDGSPYARRSNGNANGNSEPDWIEGDLLFSDVTIEPSTGVVSLRATFENHNNILLPGMYVRAVIEEGVQDGAILAPQKAVQRDTRGRPYVLVLTREKPMTSAQGETGTTVIGNGQFFVQQRMVELGRDYRNNWLIQSGLNEGDLLLIDGLQRARVGQLVAGIDLDTQNASLAQNAGEAETAAAPHAEIAPAAAPAAATDGAATGTTTAVPSAAEAATASPAVTPVADTTAVIDEEQHATTVSALNEIAGNSPRQASALLPRPSAKVSNISATGQATAPEAGMVTGQAGAATGADMAQAG
ncbi:efflux RND transporter periplasmic adaptor subunit [Desulfovibrio sp. OttesenSCG-928-C06]|nr:efflux RND transporter periplasmic adaptor subunit [Desulfovibrio sp. OttesenSCG-928-C06]